MSALTQALVDVGFSPRRADAIEAAILSGAPSPSAEDVPFTPGGNIAATDVQAAIEELDTEKVSTARTLTAGNGLTGGGDLSADRSFAVGAGAGISVAADAVALADMADSTIKGRASGAGTGAPQDLTAAQVRSIINPGLVLLNSGTVSSAATLDIVLTSFTAYRGLRLMLSAFVPATDDRELWLRTSTNGGSSYDAGASDYAWINNLAREAVGIVLDAVNPDTKIVIAGLTTTGTLSVSNTSSEGGAHVILDIMGQTATSRWGAVKYTAGYVAGSGSFLSLSGTGWRLASADIDAVRFLFESGNISSGGWALYGYA